MTERKPEIVKKPEQKPPHPLVNSFAQQIGAALDLARHIKEQAKSDTPKFVQRFLDEFDKKAA